MRRIDSTVLDTAEVVGEVFATIRSGGVVVMPTDTVYGIFCDPAQPAAIERIYALKNRPREKALALHAGDVEAFLGIVGENAVARELARAFLPGALTVIAERPANVPAAVAAGKTTIGVRVPDHALCLAILAATGPLAGTSANLSGRPAFSGGAVPPDFPDADLLVDDGVTPLETESTVIDVSQPRAHLIRAGAIPVANLEKVLGTRLR